MTMNMRALVWLGLAGVTGVSSCAEERPPISHVETGVVDKEIFEGSWYMSTTVIDVDYEGASLSFEGDSAYDFSGSFFTLPHLRWVIEKDYLLGYRDYELTQNTDSANHPEWEENPDEFRADPVAAFPIESHFDIRRSYNATTGEESNILEENSTDKNWWERRFMRVDFNTNEAESFQMLGSEYLWELFSYYTKESSSFQIEEGDAFPEDWKPTFRAMSCDGWDDENCDPQDMDHAGDYEKGDIYYMSFVTQSLLTPGLVPDPFGPGLVPWCTSIYNDAPMCTTNLITMRHAFMKRSPLRQYEALNYEDQTRFDRFGLFRIEQSVFDRQVGSPGDPQRGFTDAMNYAAIRHNMWRQWYTESEDGTRTPVPFEDRDVRPIIYYMTKDMPYHLIKTSFEVAADWNVHYMRTVRALRGADAPDPDAIAGGYDPYAPFGDPRNPYDCQIQDASGGRGDSAEPAFAASQAEEDASGPVFDSDFSRWAQGRMVGDECVLLGRVNSCIANPDDPATASDESMPCEERGDIRYHFISYVSQPGTPFLGVATLRGDPITGEYIAGDANIGGPALDSYRTRALLWLDVAAGRLSPESIIAGEDLRNYFERLGQVDAPVVPLRDFRLASSVSMAGFEQETISSKFEGAMERAEDLRLQGPEASSMLFDHRMEMIRGTEMEQQLLSNDELFVAADLWGVPDGAEPSEALLDAYSFSRTSPAAMIDRSEERQRFYDERTMEFAGEGFDFAMLRYAMDNKDKPRSQVVYEVNRELYKGTQSHELGHCMGQRHNFAATSDVANYSPEYWDIDAEFPWPNPDDYDGDLDGQLDADEEADYRDAWAASKENRDYALIAQHMSTSTMDYSADFYEDKTAMGRYDGATILFAYGDMVEVHDNASGAAPDSPEVLQGPRSLVRWYGGGESCETAADCPANQDQDLRPYVAGQPTQTCVDRGDSGLGELASGACSNFYDDMHAQAATDATSLPVDYRFCTDDRVGSIGWCHRFDKGASFQEIVANQRERYHRDYIFSNFRRFRSGYGAWSVLSRVVGRIYRPIVDIFQNMFHRYTYEEGYTLDDGPFGFYDQYIASANALNFFVEVVGQPQPGGYNHNRITNEFEQTEVYTDVGLQDLNLYLGQGKYMYSVYQAGLTGIRRLERVGVYLEKIYALLMLFNRNWGWRYSLDQNWRVNYYDLFPDELTQLVSGATRDSPQDYAARVQCETFDEDFGQCGNPRVQYMNFYRGDCRLDVDGDDIPDGLADGSCRPPTREVYAGIPSIDSYGSFLIQLYSPYFALANIPTWYDTTFQRRFDICMLGRGNCSPPGEVDGVPEVACEPFTACADADYVTFTSDRYHATWMARKYERGVNDISDASITFDMVKETAEMAAQHTILTEAQDAGIVVPPYRDAPEMAADIRRIRIRRDSLENNMMWIDNLRRRFGLAIY